MDIKELQLVKRKKEQELSSTIQESIAKFYEETNTWPDWVSISLTPIYEYGYVDPVAMLVETKIDIKV